MPACGATSFACAASTIACDGARLRGTDVGADLGPRSCRRWPRRPPRALRVRPVCPGFRIPNRCLSRPAAKRSAVRSSSNPVLILCGETGSGKTTQLPKICLEAGRGVAGIIGHTQPRHRRAQPSQRASPRELDTPLGQLVGYKLRFQDHSRPEGLIKVMTDGILLAETQGDRFFDAYDTIIVDEAHERSLNIDFLLGYLKWLLPRRPDLKLVITSRPAIRSASRGTSATRRSSRLGPQLSRRGCAIARSSSRKRMTRQPRTNRPRSSQRSTSLWREQAGDILVFLSGEREIRENRRIAAQTSSAGVVEVLPLYSRLSQEEQQRVFRPAGRRRIVLATNVAETSLTVPGIRAVIDTGVARISRYSHRSRLQRLPSRKVSQASANQRSGRCGRVARASRSGSTRRTISVRARNSRSPRSSVANLAAVILQMHALKLGEIEAFPLSNRRMAGWCATDIAR